VAGRIPIYGLRVSCGADGGTSRLHAGRRTGRRVLTETNVSNESK
jgi:hypothetical protein